MNEPGPSGPTVILVGGPMTAEDGSELDSRQPIADDPGCRIMRTCLAGSMRWWLTIVSLVEPLLRAAADDAYCLIIGARTLLELEADGSVRRTRLRSVIPGGLSTIEIVHTGIGESLDPKYERAGVVGPPWNGESMGEVGLRYSEPRLPWRVLDGNEWYLKHAGPVLRPAVIVDTTDFAPSFEALTTRRLFDERSILVLPHTQAAERHLRAYSDARGAKPTASRHVVSVPWDPEAPRDPVQYTKLVPVTANFGVTGLVQRQEWTDPADLESARALLQTRFDLRIGIWDLVRHPLLRRTLLDATPTPPTPPGEAPVPPVVAQRARQGADRATAKSARQGADRATAKPARSRIVSLCNASLWDGGWRRRWQGDFSYEQLGEPLPHWSGAIEPVAFLTLTIRKRQTSVIVHSVFASKTAHQSLREQADRFAEIARPGRCDVLRDSQQVLWLEVGGWADDVDWPGRAAELVGRTREWVTALKPYTAECRHFQREELPKRQLITETLRVKVRLAVLDDKQRAVEAGRCAALQFRIAEAAAAVARADEVSEDTDP